MRPAKRNTSHCFSVFANGYFPCSLHVGSVLCCFGFNLGTQFLRLTVNPSGFVAGASIGRAELSIIFLAGMVLDITQIKRVAS